MLTATKVTALVVLCLETMASQQLMAQTPADETAPPATEATAPLTLKDLMETGDEAFSHRDYDKALTAYNEAIKLDGANAAAFAGRARTWGRKHYRDRELADLGMAIRLEPANAAYRVARGNSWSAQGEHARAMADYDQALRLEPNNPDYWVARGNEWRKDLKLDEAIADYSRATHIDPRFADAYIARGQTWKQRRAFDRAIAEYSALIQVDPENSEGHRALARILATCTVEDYRDGARAIALATKACELTNWKDPDCLDTLAAACAEARDFAAAIKWQTQALRLSRQATDSILLRAQNVGGRRGVGFEDRLAFYKSKKPTRE
jgi:tetratricopeptide (TPR) repeat protein